MKALQSALELKNKAYLFSILKTLPVSLQSSVSPYGAHRNANISGTPRASLLCATPTTNVNLSRRSFHLRMLNKHNKAQATIEFIVLIGFMFLIFTLFAALLHTRTGQVITINDQIKMQEISDILITEADLAETVGDGYSRMFELPPTLDGFDYNATLQDQQDLLLTYKDQQFIYFLNQQVFGQPAKGKNLITNVGTLINITSVG